MRSVDIGFVTMESLGAHVDFPTYDSSPGFNIQFSIEFSNVHGKKLPLRSAHRSLLPKIHATSMITSNAA